MPDYKLLNSTTSAVPPAYGAKLGSDYKKPDAVTAFTPENYRDKVWPLPASDLLGVGRATERKLASSGIHTIGDIAAAPPSMLRGFLGKWGLILHFCI